MQPLRCFLEHKFQVKVSCPTFQKEKMTRNFPFHFAGSLAFHIGLLIGSTSSGFWVSFLIHCAYKKNLLRALFCFSFFFLNKTQIWLLLISVTNHIFRIQMQMLTFESVIGSNRCLKEMCVCLSMCVCLPRILTETSHSTWHRSSQWIGKVWASFLHQGVVLRVCCCSLSRVQLFATPWTESLVHVVTWGKA